MKFFDIEWDGMGFTDDEALTDMEISEENCVVLTAKLRESGQLPSNVIRIVHAHTAAEGESEGEWKFFLNVRLVVTAKNEDQAENADQPTELLRIVSDIMLSPSSDFDDCDLAGTFEVLTIDEISEAEAASSARH